jgi:hypothetical protein
VPEELFYVSLEEAIRSLSQHTVEKWTGISVSTAVAPTKILENRQIAWPKKEKEENWVPYGW